MPITTEIFNTEWRRHPQALAKILQRNSPLTERQLQQSILDKLNEEAWFAALAEENQKLFFKKLLALLLDEKINYLQTQLSQEKNLDDAVEAAIQETRTTARLSPETNKMTDAMRRAQILQWILVTVGLAFAAMALAGVVAFPPLILPALIGITAINIGKLALNGQGLLADPDMDKIISTAALTGSIILVGMVILFPPFAPIAGIGLSIFTLATESFKVVKEVMALVQNAKTLKNAKHAQDRKSIIDAKKQRSALTVNTIESGIKIGLALVVIGLAIATPFFPPLLFASGVVAGLSVLGFMTYNKFAKPRLIKALDKMAEESVPLLNETSEASHDDRSKITPSISHAPSPPAPHFVHDEKASLTAMREAKTTSLVIYEHATAHDHHVSLMVASAYEKNIEDAVRKILRDQIKNIEFQPGKVVVFLKDADKRISIRAHAMKTNSPEDKAIIQAMAKIAEKIGWKSVLIGPGLNTALKNTAITEAKNANLIVANEGGSQMGEKETKTLRH